MRSAQSGQKLIPMRGEGRDFLFDIVIPGAIAGLIGGSLLLAIYLPISAIFGHGWFRVLKVIARLVIRDVPLAQMGTGSIFVGLAVHYVVAMVLGGIFAALLPRSDGVTIPSAVMAILFGIVSYTLMVYLFSAYLDRPFPGAIFKEGWAIGHLAFGIGLVMVPALRRLNPSPAPLRDH